MVSPANYQIRYSTQWLDQTSFQMARSATQFGEAIPVVEPVKLPRLRKLSNNWTTCATYPIIEKPWAVLLITGPTKLSKQLDQQPYPVTATVKLSKQPSYQIIPALPLPS